MASDHPSSTSGQASANGNVNSKMHATPAKSAALDALSMIPKCSSPVHDAADIEIPGEIKTKKQFIMFDLDNTLILSEKPAFMAVPQLVTELLHAKGVNMSYMSENLTAEFMGHSFKMMMGDLATKYGFKLFTEDILHFKKREEELVIESFKKNGKICDGVLPVLKKLKESGLTMAVVSSSSINRITECMKHAGIDEYFDEDKIFSATTMCNHAKPEPDVYVLALKRLGALPEECVTVEDSRVGLLAAREAGIPSIGYTGAFLMPAMQEQLEIDFADQKAVAVMHHWCQFLGVLRTI